MLLNELLKEFIFNCQCRRLSDRTIKGYQKQVQYLLNYLEEEHHVTTLEAVEPSLIKQFLMVMVAKGRKESYVNDLLKAFKCYFKYVFEENYIGTLLTEKIKNLKEPKTIIKTFSNKEIKGMIDYFNGYDFYALRNKAILSMFFDTGMRLSEVITLLDTQVRDNYILVHGKGNKERVVPKSPFLAKVLFKYVNARDSFFQYKCPPPNVFLSKNARPLTHERIEGIVKEAGTFAKVHKDIRVSPHTCRHTFAQMQLKNGLDLYTLSRLLGHENVSITQRYLEGLKDTEVIDSAMKTSPLMNL